MKQRHIGALWRMDM